MPEKPKLAEESVLGLFGCAVIAVSGGVVSLTTAKGDSEVTRPHTFPAIGSLDVVTSVQAPFSKCSSCTAAGFGYDTGEYVAQIVIGPSNCAVVVTSTARPVYPAGNVAGVTAVSPPTFTVENVSVALCPLGIGLVTVTFDPAGVLYVTIVQV